MKLTATEQTDLRESLAKALEPTAIPPWLTTLLPIIMKMLAALLGGLTPSLSEPEQEQCRGAIAEAIQPNAMPDWLVKIWPVLLKALIAFLSGIVPPEPPPPGKSSP